MSNNKRIIEVEKSLNPATPPHFIFKTEQIGVFLCEDRFIYFRGDRRIGKTTAAIVKAIDAIRNGKRVLMLVGNEPCRIEAIRKVNTLLGSGWPIKGFNIVPRDINWDKYRGHKVDVLILDDVEDIDEDWLPQLRAMIMDDPDTKLLFTGSNEDDYPVPKHVMDLIEKLNFTIIDEARNN